MVYLPFAQSPVAAVTVVARTDGDPLRYVPAARSAVAAVDPVLPLNEVAPLARLMDAALSAQRFRGVLLGVFAALGLLIAALGVYAVTAQGVGERTREVGIRMALGATSQSVVRLLVLEAMTWVGVGIAAGVVVSRLAGVAIRKLLFGAGGVDAAAVFAVVAVLAAVAAVAAWLPVRRAAAIPPSVALSAE
ncbi:MAG TPA: FtsX-like permease family protein [Gemmatimonadaceae bacterium]|nr:FtsX-like permease family protein [Gemmatimonadaceae bacterium]